MHQIDLGRLDHPAIQNYLTYADRRSKAGARFVFDALGIPMPEYLKRKPAGRPYSKRILAAYRADHPESPQEYIARRKQDLASRFRD